VTDFIREFANITTEITFVGRADHFQLWQPDAFHEAQKAARAGRGFTAGRPG
jgi:MraZ protein